MKNITEKKVFRSRISILLVVVILAIFIPISIKIFQNKAYQGLYVIGGSFFIIALLFSGMRYIISKNKLILKIWFIDGWSIDIADISSVERSYNLLSAPAASLKRLRIIPSDTEKYMYMFISPVREQKFIKELKALNPNIHIHVSNNKGILRIQDWDI